MNESTTTKPLLRKTSRMRVLFVTPFKPEQAGEASYATDYAVNLSRKFSERIELIVLTRKGNAFTRLNPLVLDLLPKQRFLSAFATFLYLIRTAIRYKPDLIHITYGPNSYYGGRLGEPLALFLLFTKLKGIPTLITMHSMWLPEDIGERHKRTRFRKINAIAALQRIYVGLTYGVLVRLSDKVLFLTSASGARHTERFRIAYRLPDKLGEEIHGLNTVRTSSTKRNSHTVMSFGFFRYDKGYHVLIHAFPRVLASDSKARLFLIGRPETKRDQTYVAELLREAAELGVSSKVQFVLRFVDDSELQTYMKSTDVFVFPYLRNIGASGSVHQAIGFLKPMVLTTIGYNAEIDFALQVPCNNVEALSDAILEALAISDWRKSDRGKRQESYARSHSWDAVAESNFAIYQDLVKAKGKTI